MLIEPKTRIALRWKHVRRSLKTGAFFEAWRQLRRLRHSAESPWLRSPRDGYLRGIDFYAPSQLKWIMATAMRDFRTRHGVYPNICNPINYRDKVFWFKFFGEVRTGLAGDKLAMADLLPPGIRTAIQVPEVVWHSATAVLPDNDELPTGHYYLKASHGSGLFKRIRYPLSPLQRTELNALTQKWLASEYGLHDGEWWYHCFEPQVFLEKDVCGHDESEAWNFLILNGKLAMISLYVKARTGNDLATWLDPDFRPLPYQSVRPRAPISGPPPCAEEMKSLALTIGQDFSSVRVDFLVGAGRQPYLGELTFSPGNALTKRHPDFEVLLGSQWRILR